MKLNCASSYALHALVQLARTKPNQLVPAHVLAKADEMPERFLLKILKPLVDARILHSVKGPNGGFRLARRTADISVLEIIEAVDAPASLASIRVFSSCADWSR
jgi:Rrf2 family protein